MDFTGLSAFPLSPLRDERLDEAAYVKLIERLRVAGVDSIGALGSTGCYPYFSRTERANALRLATEHSGAVPVIAGIGALRTRDVLWLAEDAQKAGTRFLPRADRRRSVQPVCRRDARTLRAALRVR